MEDAMDTEQATASLQAFKVLISGTVVDREAVLDRLDSKNPGMDLTLLRDRVHEALKDPYSVDKVGSDLKSDKAWTRCWLLAALGRVAGDDTAAIDYLKAQTLPENEPNDWARYRALESLIAGGAEPLGPTAAKVIAAADRKNEKLARHLAVAYLAARGERDQCDNFLNSLKEKDWTCLRALRVMPVREAVGPLCEIVRSSQFTNVTYDATAALGAIPRTWDETDKAADALMYCIREARRHPWWDSLRCTAITSLGKLAVRTATPVLVDELAAGDPSIVCEAARGLERTAGVRLAVARVVEAASAGGSGSLVQYANALRWMQRTKVVEELESIMSQGPQDQRSVARDLLSEVGGRIAFDKLRARTGVMKHHMALLESTEKGIREMFDSSISEARSGYKLATVMDTVVFALGIGLIVLAAYQIVSDKLELAAFAGTGGVMGVIYNLFFSNPRKRVQQAVGHLLGLKVVFLGYLRQLHQADRAFFSRFIEETTITPEVARDFAALIGETMNEAIAHIQKFKSGSKQGEDQHEDETTQIDL
jgi:HEAT repeat protein